MRDQTKGILAAVGACTVWGLSPIYYKLLDHVPAPEVLAHRALWSLLFFAAVLGAQGRLRELRAALTGWRQVLIVAVASLMISINWFFFIFSVQLDRTTEASLGYYIFPLVAVLIGRFWFREALTHLQWGAVALAALAVAVLTIGLGVAPYISLLLAVSFGLYGAIKKQLPMGPVVSVTAEITLFLPIALALLAHAHGAGQGAFTASGRDAVLLICAGPITAFPLILFSYGARRVAMSTSGLVQYLNPTLQFFCAVVLFSEPFTRTHQVAFGLIWLGVGLYVLSSMRARRLGAG